MIKTSSLKFHIMKASWLNYLHRSIYICLVKARISQHKVTSRSRVYTRCCVGYRVTTML